MEKKNELVSILQGLLSSHEESDVFSASEDFSSKITEILSELTSKAKKEEPKLDVTLLCEFMTPAENELLWEMLLLYTNSLINTLTEDEDEERSDMDQDQDQDQDAEADNKTVIVTMLRKVASVLSQYFELSAMSPRPGSFSLTLQALHNILVPLDEDIAGANELKQSIARLCERSWHQEEAGCELLMTQLIPFLLLNVLDSCTTRDADVKRLFSIRDAFSLLDYEDESIQTIQGLLLRCFTDPSFLKIAEGRRFLSFTFALHADLHPLIVGVMKPQLGAGNSSVAQAYGDILFRAWRDLTVASAGSSSSSTAEESDPSASEERGAALQLLASLEDNLQDMAHNAIHARERKYFKSLRAVLNVFHENKNSKSVDSLLLKVYGPIMWRSLRCAHPLVRMQAAVIFFDCFPLQHSAEHVCSIRETEQLLQKQFDLLHTLLKDADHRVRAVAAFGVCKILRTFWEVIPTGTTHQILTFVVSTLGVDASCASVRASVVNGMSELLENPLSHIALKGLLPMLSNSVHDFSERVRVSFLKLLCKIKTTRGFKFYDIVSIDQLCNQLSADVHRPAICSVMTQLLLNSFYPRAEAGGGSSSGGGSPVKSTEYGVEQIKRCLQFSHSHPEAAAVFYANLHLHTSVGSATKMFVGLWNTLRDNMQKAPSSDDLLAEVERVATVAAGQQKHGAKKRGSKRPHVGEEEDEAAGHQGARRAFVATVSLCHQVLLVLVALLQSTRRLLATNATYKLSKEMLLTHVSPAAMQAMLSRLLDFQKGAAVALRGGSEEMGGVAGLVQSCVARLLEVVAMVSSVSGSGSVEAAKEKGGKAKNSSGGDGAPASLFTAEGIISLYFANHNEGGDDEACAGYASSILDAAIALHLAQGAPLPKKTGKKTARADTAVHVSDFVLWRCLEDRVSGMRALLGGEEGGDKQLGKRKKGAAGGGRAVGGDAPGVVRDFCKSVQLVGALLEGQSSTIAAFREDVLTSEENFSNLQSVFSALRGLLASVVNDSGSYGGALSAEGGEDQAMLMFKCEAALSVSVKLWLSVLCQRAALREDASDDISRAAGKMSIREEGRVQEQERDCSAALCAELDEALRWLTSSVIEAFEQRHAEHSGGAGRGGSASKSAQPKKHSADESLALHRLRFLDCVVASSLSVLTDALMTGIASELVLRHVAGWVETLLDIGVSSHQNACISNSVNALARQAFAIFSGKVRFPLMDPSSAGSSSAASFRSRQLSSMRDFDTKVQQLWERSVDCILLHVQNSSSSSSSGSGSGSASAVCDEEGEQLGGAASTASDGSSGECRKHTDSIDLHILYSMLQMPGGAAVGQAAQAAATRKEQQKLCSELIRRILSVIRCTASVNEAALVALLARQASSAAAAAAAAPGDKDVAARWQALAEVLQWPASDANVAALLDILLRKVCLSDSVAKHVLKSLRVMLLEAMQGRDPGAGTGAGDGQDVKTGDALLVAVLVKQVMMRRNSGDGGGEDVGLIVSAVEKLLEGDTGQAGRSEEGGAELSRQVVSLLRL